MRRYSESHEWIEVKDHVGTVGISDYAQEELGELVYVELPEVGQEVEAGQEVVVLESTKAAADLYSPVSGKITAVNGRVKDVPDEINDAAETRGWLFKIELRDLSELDALMDEAAYAGLVSS